MDLSFGELIRAAAENDPLALDNKTLWNCDTLIETSPRCPSGLNRATVIQVLREEAYARGYYQT